MSVPGRGPAPSPAPVTRRGGATPVLPIISFVLSAVAILFVPILFGGAAIVLGAIATSRRERLGKVALVVAIVATVVGIVLGAIATRAALQG